MTQWADIRNSITLDLTLFVPLLAVEHELFNVLKFIWRTGYGFTKGKGRQNDFAFIDECIAESYFIVTELILSKHEEILEKFPDEAERFKFYRMTVGYKLKNYVAGRSTSMVSKQRKKGTLVRIESLGEHVDNHCSSLDEYIALESVASRPEEMAVVEQLKLGYSSAQIAINLDTTDARILRIVRRVKRKLLTAINGYRPLKKQVAEAETNIEAEAEINTEPGVADGHDLPIADQPQIVHDGS